MVRHRLVARLVPAVAIAVVSTSTVEALAAPQTVDLFPTGPLVVTQAIQSPSAPLITGRSTFVRMTVGFNGTLPPGTLVDGRLRVFVGGVEQPYSPIHSDNGPIAVPIGGANLQQEHHTLNFIFVPPHTGAVVLRGEVNPIGPTHVPELDTANNVIGALVEFHCRRGTEIVYVPIDYRPSGGPVPNVPDAALIAPGSGDNFLQATYPAPYFDYRRSEAPSKLWTSSLSGSGSALNASLLTDMQMMSPQPDFVYGWVPGGLPYNGLAHGIPGKVAMGNTEIFRFQRTFAHEVGHLHGMVHIGGTTGLIGVDVERHLAITEQLPTIKASNLADYMVAGLNTNQAWVGLGSYMTVFNNVAYLCQQSAAAADDAPPGVRGLLIAGVFDHATGAVRITDNVEFARATPTPPVPLAHANLIVRAYVGDREVVSLPVSAASSADSCPECRTNDSDDAVVDSAFVAVLPVAVAGGASIDRLEVWRRGAREASAVVVRSTHAPAAVFVGDAPPFHGEHVVEWAASDADGDEVTHYLRYSPDGERFVPLASATKATSWRVDFTELPAARKGSAFLELLTTDGLRTTTVRLAPAETADGSSFPGARPWVHILSPDHGTTWRRGATVVLHGNAWDLEDRSLTGASVEWSSNLDGILAYGRVTQVAGLSVGTHQITMRATDSDGLSSTDTHTITVVDRALPGAPVVCQPDLGYGGPGNATLSFCGMPLAGGNLSTLRVLGAAGNAPLWLAAGATPFPIPLFGGTLFVGQPDLLLPLGNTAANGTFALPFAPAGGTALDLYLQGVVFDGAQAQGIAFTNALLARFLP